MGRRRRRDHASPTHPTLQTVADAAGVSIQTVSNIFNAPHKVHTTTRDRVQAEIDRQGYRPNRLARSLRQRRSGLLGFGVPPVATGGGGVEDQFVHAVTEAAERAGYHVLLFTEEREPVPGAEPVGEATHDNGRLVGTAEQARPNHAAASGRTYPLLPMRAYDALLGQRAVDGFILSRTTVDDPRQAWLETNDVPFAAFGRRWTENEIGSWVDIDGASGTAAVVHHLAEQGHQRVAFIGWPDGSGVGDDRLAGFRRATSARAMTVVGVERGENHHDVGAAIAHRLLSRPDPPTAIACVSDTMALGCDSAARAVGRQPGRHVAITGFDDSIIASIPAVSLTSVRQPLPLAGDHVVRLLVAQLADPDSTIERVLLEPSLVVRTSTTGRRSR